MSDDFLDGHNVPAAQGWLNSKMEPFTRHHPPVYKPKPSRWRFDTGPLKLFLLIVLLLIVITIFELLVPSA